MKLKVLFMATRDWYHPATTGGDMTMWENARYLASVGHDVTFVAAGHAGAPKTELLDGIKVVRLGGIHSLWFRTFVRYVSQWRGHYDVVVAEGFGGSRIPRMTPLYVKEPIITEWHQVHRALFAVQYPRLLNGPLNLLERVTARVHRDTLVRAGTEDWFGSFMEIGFKPDNIFVVPVSIREEWLSAPHHGPSSEPRILWLGKLRRYKCPDHAIRAMTQVTRQVKNAHLTIAGRRDDTRYAKELRNLVERLGLGDSVDFQFDLTEAAKHDLISASRIVVVTSAVEGFGIVVLEANASGVPVVASSGVPQGAVRDRFNGLRYPFGDIDALSKAIVEILTDEPLHAELSANGLAFARNFSWQTVGSQFEAVVQMAATTRPINRRAHDNPKS
jgi:glycosyltransferase involved in cell wall biosynthesis